jgi:hypothetical protein
MRKEAAALFQGACCADMRRARTREVTEIVLKTTWSPTATPTRAHPPRMQASHITVVLTCRQILSMTSRQCDGGKAEHVPGGAKVDLFCMVKADFSFRMNGNNITYVRTKQLLVFVDFYLFILHPIVC